MYFLSPVRGEEKNGRGESGGVRFSGKPGLCAFLSRFFQWPNEYIYVFPSGCVWPKNRRLENRIEMPP